MALSFCALGSGHLEALESLVRQFDDQFEVLVQADPVMSMLNELDPLHRCRPRDDAQARGDGDALGPQCG